MTVESFTSHFLVQDNLIKVLKLLVEGKRLLRGGLDKILFY